MTTPPHMEEHPNLIIAMRDLDVPLEIRQRVCEALTAAESRGYERCKKEAMEKMVDLEITLCGADPFGHNQFIAAVKSLKP